MRGRPQLDRTHARPATECEALDLLCVWCQADPVNAGRCIALRIAEQREQTWMPRAVGAERAARMEAQHVVDIGGGHPEIELAHLNKGKLRPSTRNQHSIAPHCKPPFEGVSLRD